MTRTSAPALVAWRNAVATAFALGGLLLAAWGPRLPAIKQELQLSDGALGLLVVGSTIASIVGLLSSSALYARLGGRRGIPVLLSTSGVGVVVVGLGAGVWHSAAVVEVGFLALGFGIGAVDVMINVEGSALEQASGKVVMPVLHACWSAGAVIGSAIGAGAAAVDVAPQWQFGVEGVLVVVVAWVASRAVPEREGVAPAEAEPVGRRLRAWLRSWRDTRLIVIGLVMLGVELGEGSANNWLTLGVAQEHGQTQGVAALFFTAFAASEMTARFAAGPVVQRFGRVAVVRATTAAGIVGLVLFIVGGPAWVVLVGVVLWAVGVSMGFPLGMSAAAESGPNPASRVSVVASVGYLANLAGPPVIGFLSEGVGLLGAFWLLVVLMAVALSAAGSLAPGRPAPAKTR